ncbi:MAG TPA: FKBP-type peptidyl-prolyl cis-trans isomerase [Solirubrobacteraceae bacterium]|nr:FKBP-type peptidyl-prolyl cis-trans isomerase [Solirubrobacteraceae bacterium]
MRGRLIALLSVAALGIGGCGDDEGGDAGLVPAIPAETPTETATTPATSTTGRRFRVASIEVSKDTSKKPTITKPSGDPPTELVTKDIVVGKGAAAKNGDQLEMHYLGAHFTGEQFESSWDEGDPFALTLGEGMVIPGWDQGIVGMKEGGRRLLVIPPELAYADQGQGDIQPGETLIFVVDVVKRTTG